MRLHVPVRLIGGGLSSTCVAALLGAVLLCNAVKVSAQAAGPAENLTLALLAMHKRYQGASSAERGALAAQFRSVAAQRQQLLRSLIQTNSAEVLRVQLPRSITALDAERSPLADQKEQAAVQALDFVKAWQNADINKRRDW